MIIEPQRQLLRRETDFDEGFYSLLQHAVIDLVHIGPVVNRVALRVLIVDAVLIVEDGVKTYIAEVGDVLHRAHVVAIALPQGEIGAARSEHLLPEMRQWRSMRLGVDGDRL